MSQEENGCHKGSNCAKQANRVLKTKQCSEEPMSGAMEAVVDGSSISGAAREYSVPQTTLQDRVHGKVTHGGDEYNQDEEYDQDEEYNQDEESGQDEEYDQDEESDWGEGWGIEYDRTYWGEEFSGDYIHEESLFQRRVEEGYDIFDEPYVRWLMVRCPEAVKREWLDKMPSSGIGPSGQKCTPQQKETNGAKNKPRKRSIVGLKFGALGETEYISEYSHQAIPLPKEKPKRIRITGARVLTSDEAMHIVQEKEDAKKTEGIRKKTEEGKRDEKETKAKGNQREQN